MKTEASPAFVDQWATWLADFVFVQIKNKPNRLFLRDWKTQLNFTLTTKAGL